MPVLLDGVSRRLQHPGSAWMPRRERLQRAGLRPADASRSASSTTCPTPRCRRPSGSSSGCSPRPPATLTVRVHLFSLPGVAARRGGRAHMRRTYAGIDRLGAAARRADRHGLRAARGLARRRALLGEPHPAGRLGRAQHDVDAVVVPRRPCGGAAPRRHRRAPLPASARVSSSATVADAPAAGGRCRGCGCRIRAGTTCARTICWPHGYQVLTRSPTAGVDMFVQAVAQPVRVLPGPSRIRRRRLAREYRRDVGRFLRGERAHYPALPQNYFDGATEAALAAFRARAWAQRGEELLAEFPVPADPALSANWQPFAVHGLSQLAVRHLGAEAAPAGSRRIPGGAAPRPFRPHRRFEMADSC